MSQAMPTPAADHPEPYVLKADREGVRTLTLNRPKMLNALSRDMLAAIQVELDALMEDPSVRVLILKGAGRAFCAGHNLKEMRADGSKEALLDLFRQCSRTMVSLTRIPQPVIASVGGIATAAGCQLVAQCDLAVASEEAQFATSGVNVGLFCSTPSVAVTRNLGRKKAAELLFTGDFLDAATAMAEGLVNQVVPAAELDAATDALADRIAAKAPAAIATGKRILHTQLELGLEAAYEAAAEAMAENMMARDTQAGIDAFIEKRPMPEWKGE